MNRFCNTTLATNKKLEREALQEKAAKRGVKMIVNYKYFFSCTTNLFLLESSQSNECQLPTITK